jgi:hypothetical protein
MTFLSEMNPIVRNIKTNDLYQYEGENKFTNLRTGKSGVVSDEVARKSFVVNVEATSMFDEFPIVKEMVQRLNLKFQKQ